VSSSSHLAISLTRSLTMSGLAEREAVLKTALENIPADTTEARKFILKAVRVACRIKVPKTSQVGVTEGTPTKEKIEPEEIWDEQERIIDGAFLDAEIERSRKDEILLSAMRSAARLFVLEEPEELTPSQEESYYVHCIEKKL